MRLKINLVGLKINLIGLKICQLPQSMRFNQQPLDIFEPIIFPFLYASYSHTSCLSLFFNQYKFDYNAKKFIYILNDAAVPILEKDAYVVSMDYSPLLAGFSIVLKDGRAAFLTSSNLKFDPNVRNLMNYALFNYV
jgi:hypothetical protein